MMNKLFTFILVLFCANVLAQKKEKSTLSFYANVGFNYGIRDESLDNNSYNIKTKITPLGGLGIRKCNKKYNRMVDLQLGVATSNNFLQNSSNNVSLQSTSNDVGAGKGIHTFLAVKFSGLQMIPLLKDKKKNINAIFGIGIQYVPLLSNNFEEIFDNQNNNYSAYYIFYDFKYKKENNIYIPQTTKRPISLQAYCGVQYFPTNNNFKNFGLEFFWNPSITPAIYGIYDININFATFSKGIANQMLSSFGLKVMYTFNILLDK